MNRKLTLRTECTEVPLRRSNHRLCSARGACLHVPTVRPCVGAEHPEGDAAPRREATPQNFDLRMPVIGDLAPQRCSDCSGLMYWVLDACVGEADGREYPAYRCPNGHISEPCRVCGSRNTTRYGAGPLAGRRILSCGACGNQTAFHS